MDMIGAQGRLNRGYVGIPTFLRSPLSTVDDIAARYAVFGVPYDEGSPFLPGSRFGPRAIREHSLRFSPDGLFDPGSGQRLLVNTVRNGMIADLGDVDIVPSSPARTFKDLTDFVTRLRAKGVVPVMIGGDHAVSFPAVRAFANETLHVIQLDAHIDYGTYDDEFRYGNGQGFRQIKALPHVASLTQIGIRSLRTNPADFAQAQADGSHLVTMPQLRAAMLSEAIAHVPQGAKVYLSIDIDAYDAPLVPGCVSAEPDGLTFSEMRGLLEAIAGRFDIVGCDLVEVNPPLDAGTGVTAYLGALTLALFLGFIEATATEN